MHLAVKTKGVNQVLGARCAGAAACLLQKDWLETSHTEASVAEAGSQPAVAQLKQRS